MKRVGNLYAEICSIENLKVADEKARKVYNKPFKGKILQLGKTTHEYIAIHNSIKDAAIAIGRGHDYKHISEVCNGRVKSAYGYFWQYDEN